MPRTAINYQTTVVYKIVCKDLSITDCYVGHTTNFKHRKNEHKYNCNNEDRKGYTIFLYQFIRSNGGWENWSMVEVEKFPCADANEAYARERFHYERLNATLNCCFPIRDRKEYLEAINKKLKEYAREYRETHKEILKEKCKLKVICECGIEIRKSDISRHKKSKRRQQLLTEQAAGL